MVAEFLLSDDVEALREGILRNGIEVLRNPNIQKIFSEMLLVGRSELQVDEINWDRVIANWDLPFPKKKGRK